MGKRRERRSPCLDSATPLFFSTPGRRETATRGARPTAIRFARTRLTNLFEHPPPKAESLQALRALSLGTRLRRANAYAAALTIFKPLVNRRGGNHQRRSTMDHLRTPDEHSECSGS